MTLKLITKHACSLCGKVFDDEDQAICCEKGHAFINMNVPIVVRYSPNKNMPMWLDVEMDDGSIWRFQTIICIRKPQIRLEATHTETEQKTEPDNNPDAK